MCKNILLTILFVTLISVSCKQSSQHPKVVEEAIQLRFNNEGSFKIAQFTDIHWDASKENCDTTRQSIKFILAQEKPDLAVLTGDVVTSPPAKDGWYAIAKIFEEAQVPWCIVLGNHDAETDIEVRSEIFEVLDTLSFFVGTRGPDSIHGAGNYSLPILAKKGDEIKSVLYFIDSNNRPTNYRYGDWDWIYSDQIDWYRKTSKEYINKRSKVIPSLAFIHIPLIEYNNIVGTETMLGTKGEGISSPEVNTGLFSAFLEMGDVMGVFCGHDHENDFIGIDKDIALAYGRRSGQNAYGSNPIGARIITLFEDQRKFETCIVSQTNGTEFLYYYPVGVAATDEKMMPMLKATDVSPTKNGVSYNYFEGKFARVSDLGGLIPVKFGELNNITLEPAQVEDWMGFEYNAWIKIPETGVYRFYIYSDDGSVLYIDGQLVVDNDGSHSARRKDAKVHLEKGFHDLKILYIERYMGQELQVGYIGRSYPETLIPDSILFVKKENTEL